MAHCLFIERFKRVLSRLNQAVDTNTYRRNPVFLRLKKNKMSALRILTPKQEAFCIAYMETMNASAAYRTAYNTVKMSPVTINRNAKALMDNNKITARLNELRAPAVEKAQITLEIHLSDLKRLRDSADKEGKFSAAVAAEIARGKASGLYIEKFEHSGDPNNPVQIIQRIELVAPANNS